MPYLAHFGLEDHPFTLTPDVDYFFPTPEHANIIASVEFALRRDTGIIKVVGEVGTGKTLLCRLLMRRLVDTDTVAYINAPRANAQSIILAICEEFGIAVDPAASPYTTLNRFLVAEHEKGRMAVVVVDEAQHLGKDGLEAVRLISNLETEKSKLLQIVLFGQTELDDLLRDPALRQLNQRVVFSLTTKPMTAEESIHYIDHRVGVSRRAGIEYGIFSDKARELIARHSRGIPRVINILADKSLLAAFAAGSPVVQPAHVMEAVRDSAGLAIPGGTRPPPWLRIAKRIGIAVVAAAAVAAGIWGVAIGMTAWRSAPHPPPVAAASAPAATPALATAMPPVDVHPVTAPSEPAPAATTVVAVPARPYLPEADVSVPAVEAAVTPAAPPAPSESAEKTAAAPEAATPPADTPVIAVEPRPFPSPDRAIERAAALARTVPASQPIANPAPVAGPPPETLFLGRAKALPPASRPDVARKGAANGVHPTRPKRTEVAAIAHHEPKAAEMKKAPRATGAVVEALQPPAPQAAPRMEVSAAPLAGTAPTATGAGSAQTQPAPSALAVDGNALPPDIAARIGSGVYGHKVAN